MNIQIQIKSSESLRTGLSRAIFGVVNKHNIPHNTIAMIGTYDALASLIEERLKIETGDIIQIHLEIVNDGLKDIRITQLGIKKEFSVDSLKLTQEAINKLVEITEKSSFVDEGTKGSEK